MKLRKPDLLLTLAVLAATGVCVTTTLQARTVSAQERYAELPNTADCAESSGFAAWYILSCPRHEK